MILRTHLSNTNGKADALKLLIITCVLLICMTLLPGCGGRVVFVREFPDDILFVMNDEPCVCDEYRIYLGSLQYENSAGVLKELMELYPQAREDLQKHAMERLETVKALRLYAGSAGILLTHEEETGCEENAARFCSLNAAYGDKTELAAGIFKDLALYAKTKESIMSEYAAEISDDEARVVTVLEFFAPFENYASPEEAHDAVLEAQEKMMAAPDAGMSFSAYAEEAGWILTADHPDANTAVRTISREGEDSETVMLVFELEDGETSQILRTEEGYYVWYCISAFDQALCDENKRNLTAKRRQEVYDSVLAGFVSELDFSLDRKQFERLLSGEDTALNSSVFEMSGTWQE